jgi:hypothetical protein
MPATLFTSGLLRERLVVAPVAGELPSYKVGLFRRSTMPLTPAAHELATQLKREAAYLGTVEVGERDR